MKEIKYKTLKVQNFLSVGNDVIEISFSKGLNQITGKNIDEPDRKNAVGKTVIMQAFFYALFGETLDKIKKEFIPNNVTDGKGSIELEFDVTTSKGTQSYTIKRQIKPAKVELWSGDVDLTQPSIANTNEYICNILQTNPTIHKCCEVMTIRETTPFMDMDAKDKRTFIEDIFSIEVFGKMMKELKKMISDNKKDIEISAAKLTEIRVNISTLKAQKDKIIKESLEREQRLKDRKQSIKDKIDAMVCEIDKIEVKDVQELKEKHEKLVTATNQMRDKVNKKDQEIVLLVEKSGQIGNKIDKIESVEGGVYCSKCLQEIPHTHIEALECEIIDLKKEKRTLDETIIAEKTIRRDFQEKFLKLQAGRDKVGDTINENKQNITKKQALERTLKELQKSLNEVDDDIQVTNVSGDTMDQSIKDTEKRETEETENHANLRQNEDDLNTIKFIIGDEGVKSVASKKLLTILNTTIDHYLNKLGLNLRCKFNEFFDEIITDSRGKTLSYKNGSGAEKKSLDFACALSFSDMRRKINQVSSNVEFYDEVFDTALCEKGLDDLMKTLKERIEKNNMSVYVISHRKEMAKHVDGEVINLEKENKITRRV